MVHFSIDKYSSYITEDTESIKTEQGNPKLIHLGIYRITELTKVMLQENKVEESRNQKEYFKNLIIELMRSAVFPLLVALVTAYLTAKYLK